MRERMQERGVDMIERKVYQCEHCKSFFLKPRTYFIKRDAYMHEISCWFNKKNKKEGIIMFWLSVVWWMVCIVVGILFCMMLGR